MVESEQPVPLAAAARRAALSPSHFRREFEAFAGESPARFQRRLRLERGAALLAAGEQRIIDVAIDTGFGSHEAFTRAFRSHFGSTPSEYRRRAVAGTPDALRWVTSIGPCTGLYQIPLTPSIKEPFVAYTIQVETLDEMPVVFGRRRVDRDDMTEALAELIPAAYGYAVESGLTLAGPPYVRYVDQSAAFFHIEAGVPVLESAVVPESRPDILAGALPAGAAATTVHVGPYDTLGDAHVALDRWIHESGATPTGGAWEVYLTDPGEVPNPADWRTKVIWPIREP